MRCNHKNLNKICDKCGYDSRDSLDWNKILKGFLLLVIFPLLVAGTFIFLFIENTSNPTNSDSIRTCSFLLADNSTPRRGVGLKIEDAGNTCDRLFKFCNSRDISLPECKSEEEYLNGTCHNSFFTETMFCKWDPRNIECNCIYYASSNSSIEYISP